MAFSFGASAAGPSMATLDSGGGGGMNLGALLAQLQGMMQGGQQGPNALQMIKEMSDPLGAVARHNAGSNLPSFAAGSTSPWSGSNPLFKQAPGNFPTTPGVVTGGGNQSVNLPGGQVNFGQAQAQPKPKIRAPRTTGFTF